MKSYLHYIFLFSSIFLIFSCKNDTCIKYFTASGIVNSKGETIPIVGLGKENTTVFVFVRHAEKNTNEGDNPNLSGGGEIRAKHLAELLLPLPIERIACTNTKRSIQTGQPLLDRLKCGTYFYSKGAIEAFLLSALEAQKGKALLVVGHSNTVHEMLNLLVGENKYTEISEKEFDNIYIVSVIEKGNAKVLAMKY